MCACRISASNSERERAGKAGKAKQRKQTASQLVSDNISGSLFLVLTAIAEEKPLYFTISTTAATTPVQHHITNLSPIVHPSSVITRVGRREGYALLPLLF